MVPISLLPTTTQHSISHQFLLDCFPFPQMRENLIKAVGLFDDCEPWNDMIDPIGGDRTHWIYISEDRTLPFTLTVVDGKLLHETLPAKNYLFIRGISCWTVSKR